MEFLVFLIRFATPDVELLSLSGTTTSNKASSGGSSFLNTQFLFTGARLAIDEHIELAVGGRRRLADNEKGKQK